MQKVCAHEVIFEASVQVSGEEQTCAKAGSSRVVEQFRISRKPTRDAGVQALFMAKRGSRMVVVV